MLWVLADNANSALAADNLAIFANLFCTCSNLHMQFKIKNINREKPTPYNELQTESNSALRQIVRRDLHFNPITNRKPNLIHSHFAGKMS